MPLRASRCGDAPAMRRKRSRRSRAVFRERFVNIFSGMSQKLPG
ncbi:hypothetical protein L810_1717 [Burkholderia sp. AU4i]|nr:hypothetical protein L810_1717 [Burkholderia sp. AU4i]